jgi:hypothetical protein
MALKDLARMKNQEAPATNGPPPGDIPQAQPTTQTPPSAKELLRSKAKSLSFGKIATPKMDVWMGGEVLEEPYPEHSTDYAKQLPKYWHKEQRAVVFHEWNPDGSQNRAMWDTVVPLDCSQSHEITVPNGEVAETVPQIEDEDDDGERRLFLSAEKMNAVKKALRRCGRGVELEPGGHLFIALTGNADSQKFGENARRVYTAVYFPPDVEVS